MWTALSHTDVITSKSPGSIESTFLSAASIDGLWAMFKHCVSYISPPYMPLNRLLLTSTVRHISLGLCFLSESICLGKHPHRHTVTLFFFSVHWDWGHKETLHPFPSWPHPTPSYSIPSYPIHHFPSHHHGSSPFQSSSLSLICSLIHTFLFCGTKSLIFTEIHSLSKAFSYLLCSRHGKLFHIIILEKKIKDIPFYTMGDPKLYASTLLLV